MLTEPSLLGSLTHGVCESLKLEGREVLPRRQTLFLLKCWEKTSKFDVLSPKVKVIYMRAVYTILSFKMNVIIQEVKCKTCFTAEFNVIIICIINIVSLIFC
jgi:hypothetical protein